MTDILQQRFKIVKRDHPHRGEIGRFTGKVVKMVWGEHMAEMKLENCRHGVDGCFIVKGGVRAVDDDDQYL